MTLVLALDLAKNSGWAVVEGDHVHDCGSWDLLREVKTTGKSATSLDTQHVIQMRRLREYVENLAHDYPLDAIVVEREFGRGASTRLLVSLYAAAQEAAYVSKLPCLGVRLGDWRRHIHGSAGKGTDFYKTEALRLCDIAGFDVPDADAAEAILIGRYASATIRIHPAGDHV